MNLSNKTRRKSDCAGLDMYIEYIKPTQRLVIDMQENIDKYQLMINETDDIAAKKHFKSEIAKFQKVIDEHEDKFILNNIFQEITETINEQLADELIHNQLAIGIANLGTIKIIRVKPISSKIDSNGNRVKRISWGETMKLKKHFLDNGIEVYDKDHNPNGEKFFIYVTENRPFIHWNKNGNTPNMKLFCFKPTSGAPKNVTSVTRKLNNALIERPELINLYPSKNGSK